MMLRGRLGASFDCLVTPKDEHSKNRKQSDFKAIYRLAIYNDLTVERQWGIVLLYTVAFWLTSLFFYSLYGLWTVDWCYILKYKRLDLQLVADSLEALFFKLGVRFLEVCFVEISVSSCKLIQVMVVTCNNRTMYKNQKDKHIFNFFVFLFSIRHSTSKPRSISCSMSIMRLYVWRKKKTERKFGTTCTYKLKRKKGDNVACRALVYWVREEKL